MATQKQVFQEALAQFHVSISNTIADAMKIYQCSALSNKMYPPQVETTAHALYRTYPGVFTEVQLTLLLIREWERLQVRYGEQLVRGEALFQRERPPSWQTIEEVACPFCDFLRLAFVPGSHEKLVECAQCDEGNFDRDVLDV